MPPHISRKRRRLLQHARMQQHLRAQALVTEWILQYGRSGYAKLERNEVAALLEHLHPDAGAPPEDVLDQLMVQATQVRTYSIHLQGNPNGSVGHDRLMSVVSGYSIYLLATQKFDQQAPEGVIALRDLPALMREANQGVVETHEIDFVMDHLSCTQCSMQGNLDAASEIAKQDLIPALQRVAMCITKDPAEPSEILVLGEPLTADGSIAEGGNETGCLEMEMEADDADSASLTSEDARRWDDIETHLDRWRGRKRRSERIQSHVRRIAAVKFFKKARAAVMVIQSAARRHSARKYFLRHRAAAHCIGGAARSKQARWLAQKRRDAATLIGRVAKGRVTRTRILNVASATRSMVPVRMVARRSRTLGDLFGRNSAQQDGVPSTRGKLSRASTAPLGHSGVGLSSEGRSRTCIVS